MSVATYLHLGKKPYLFGFFANAFPFFEQNISMSVEGDYTYLRINFYCPGSALGNCPKGVLGLCLLPCIQGRGEGAGGGAAGGGCHFLDQADSSHVLWATVQEQPQAHTVSVGDADGLWAATAKKSCPLHGLGPHLAFLLPRAQLAPTGVREMGGTGSPRRPSVGLRGRSLGPRGPRGETVLQRGAATHVQ